MSERSGVIVLSPSWVWHRWQPWVAGGIPALAVLVFGRTPWELSVAHSLAGPVLTITVFLAGFSVTMFSMLGGAKEEIARRILSGPYGATIRADVKSGLGALLMLGFACLAIVAWQASLNAAHWAYVPWRLLFAIWIFLTVYGMWRTWQVMLLSMELLFGGQDRTTPSSGRQGRSGGSGRA